GGGGSVPGVRAVGADHAAADVAGHAALRRPGDHVDGGQERLRSVEGGERPLDHLDALDGVDGDVLRPDEGAHVRPEVHRHAVDHDLREAGAGAKAAGDAANPDRGQRAVVNQVEAG